MSSSSQSTWGWISLERGLSVELTLCFRLEGLPYRKIVLGSRRASGLFEGLGSKPSTFLAAHVKQLRIGGAVPLKQAVRALEMCTGVVDLGCWSDDRSTLRLPHLIGPLPLRRLSIEQMLFRRLPMIESRSDCRWFEHLTHLELVFAQSGDEAKLGRLGKLPCLTHLCLYNPDDPIGLVENIILDCKRLRLVVISLSPTLDSRTSSLINRALLAIAQRTVDVQIANAWPRLPGVDVDLEGLSVWGAAEKEIAMREATLTPSTCALS